MSICSGLLLTQVILVLFTVTSVFAGNSTVMKLYMRASDKVDSNIFLCAQYTLVLYAYLCFVIMADLAWVVWVVADMVLDVAPVVEVEEGRSPW